MKSKEELILDDFFKIYLSAIDSYNPKIIQTINEKYTIIDKSMLSVYLFIKIIEDRNEHDSIAEETLENYMLRQLIYSETGNLALEIADKSKIELYNKVINELIIEKFEYKNRILNELNYNYKIVDSNEYTNLLDFCELISELAILNDLSRRGNIETKEYFEKRKQKFIELKIDKNDKFKKEKSEIIKQISENKFEGTENCNLLEVALNLRDVYRFSTLTTTLPENVLFHQFTMAVSSIVFAQYLNSKMGEEINIYKIIVKSLFHDFGEYKGNEIVTQVKNYNEDTIKMFKEIEKTDEKDLKEKIGENIYQIIVDYGEEKEGYISELLDKMFGIMKLWIEVRIYGKCYIYKVYLLCIPITI